MTALCRSKTRLASLSDPDAVAVLLLGACFQRAFFRRFLSEDAASVGEERFAEDVLRSLMHGLLCDEGDEQDTQ
jgi:hypothetical protein